MLKALIISLFFMVCAVSYIEAQKQFVDIGGQIVRKEDGTPDKGIVREEDGTPVEGAETFWVYEDIDPSAAKNSNLVHHLISAVGSIKDGSFGFRIKWLPGKLIRVYVLEPEPTRGGNCSRPISTFSFHSLRVKHLPGLGGIVISKYKPRIELGKFTDYIRFKRVTISLKNSPVLQKQIRKFLVSLTITDKGGKTIVRRLSGKFGISEDGEKLNLCLPYGEWNLEFSRYQKKLILRPAGKVVVDKDTEEPKELELLDIPHSEDSD